MPVRGRHSCDDGERAGNRMRQAVGMKFLEGKNCTDLRRIPSHTQHSVFLMRPRERVKSGGRPLPTFSHLRC